MMTYSLGFTGTSRKLRGPQLLTLRTYASERIKALQAQGHEVEAHHGMCIMADEAFHHTVQGLANRVIGYPSTIPHKTMVYDPTEFHVIHRPDDPLHRNREIVRHSAELIAVPLGPEVRRSGTWYTVRQARQKGIPITFIWPDGSKTSEP